MAEVSSKVCVAVRIRPLAHQETAAGATRVLDSMGKEVRLGSRRFTFDAVYDNDVSQDGLYTGVSPSLQSNFLNGYNATVMAYGQTGSGKTFTMGSEAHRQAKTSDNSGLIPRFMEGIFTSLANKDENDNFGTYRLEASFLEVYGEHVYDLLQRTRAPMPLREDSCGGVVCTGLTHKQVSSVDEAIDILHEGTMNRTTAATLMNLTSSRSHAIFTVTLHRIMKDTDSTMSSRLTFVDLAGSERMKRTGAEGLRAKEGIKINEGLLALGNVINALADEERISEKKSVHVPYRQSKLTRLLRDALGGNSQTLFLACVSPADSNASETLSTLHYANRAKNIKNAPTKNVDDKTVEIQNLKALSAILQKRLVFHRFTGDECPRKDESDDFDYESTLLRKEVNDYLSALYNEAFGSHVRQIDAETNPNKFYVAAMKSTAIALEDSSVLPSVLPKGDTIGVVDPDKEMAILDQLLDFQQREQAFHDEENETAKALAAATEEFVQQQSLLLELRERLKVYHGMQVRYEKLVAEVQHLESEKHQLANQLQKATVDPAHGCSVAIRNELDRVERNLARTRNESKKHRLMCRKAEQEANRCKTLEMKVHELKVKSEILAKKEASNTVRHRAYTESKTREIFALRKKEKNNVQELKRLQSKVQAQQRNLHRGNGRCKELTCRLKDIEEHLFKLIILRQKKKHPTEGHGARNQRNTHATATEQSVGILQEAIHKQATVRYQTTSYREKMLDYSIELKKLVEQVRSIDANRDGISEDSLLEAMQAIEDSELRVDLLSKELIQMKARLPMEEYSALSILKEWPNIGSPAVLRSLLEGVVKLAATSHLDNIVLKRDVSRKDAAIEGLELEIERLRTKLSTVSQAQQSQSTFQSTNEQTVASTDYEDLLRSHQSLTLKHDSLRTDYSVVLEQLSMFRASIHQNNKTIPKETLQELQRLWTTIGIDSGSREASRLHLDEPLKYVCQQKLKEAEGERVELQSSVDEASQQLYTFRNALRLCPVDVKDSAPSLREQLKIIQDELCTCKAMHDMANFNRELYESQTKTVALDLGLTSNMLPPCLLKLVEKNTPADLDVSTTFLQNCEQTIGMFKLQRSRLKCEIIEIYEKACTLVTDLNISDSLAETVFRAIYAKTGDMPRWWNPHDFITVQESITGGTVKTSNSFFLHLKQVEEALQKLKATRQALANYLEGAVEKSQKTLLSTVGGHPDALHAHTNFHDILTRLPKYSKERLEVCVAEMKALLVGVKTMTQSEVEILVVAWEALQVEGSVRGEFWDNIAQATKAISTDRFDLKCINSDTWMLTVAREAVEVHQELEKRILKLERIHKEVEFLSAKQEAKSTILSLDAEIRVLSACAGTLAQPVTKGTRQQAKQTKSMLTKVNQLAFLLKEWSKSQREEFETVLLSEEVSKLLFANSITNVPSGDLRKGVEGGGSTERRQKKGKRSIKRKYHKVLSFDHNPSSNKRLKPEKLNDMGASSKLPVLSPKQSEVNKNPRSRHASTPTRKRLTLPPFGHVLDQARTPQSKQA